MDYNTKLKFHILRSKAITIGYSVGLWSPGLLPKDFPEDPSWREAELSASDTLSRRVKLPPRRRPDRSV
jgi:hypothetical protein